MMEILLRCLTVKVKLMKHVLALQWEIILLHPICTHLNMFHVGEWSQTLIIINIKNLLIKILLRCLTVKVKLMKPV